MGHVAPAKHHAGFLAGEIVVGCDYAFIGANKKQMRRTSFIISLCLITDLACSQKIGMAYYGISSDSLHARHLLEFKNDSVVEVRTFPRHMSQP